MQMHYAYHVLDCRHGIHWLCTLEITLHCFLDDAVRGPEQFPLGHVADGVLHSGLAELVGVWVMAVLVVSTTVLLTNLYDGRRAASARSPVGT